VSNVHSLQFDVELPAQFTAPAHVQLSTNNLKCVFTNARSLVNKMCELEKLVHDCKPDIIGIVETWGRDNVTDQVFTIQGYTLYRRDRSEGSGGGIVIYCRDCYQTIARPDLTKWICGNFWVGNCFSQF
jgi:hypothetical protein